MTARETRRKTRRKAAEKAWPAFAEALEIERMVARRVKGGGNEQDSRALLADLLRQHTGDNLDHALAYNGFRPYGR